MKEIGILGLTSIVTFIVFILTLILGFIKKNKRLKLVFLFFFFIFAIATSWTIYTVARKSNSKVTETFKTRNRDEIYDALFGKRQNECVKILDYQDQVVPKVDYAIWLSFETCPKELKRILDRHKFSSGKFSVEQLDAKIPLGETIQWFNPKLLGDSILVFEYSSDDSRNIQTIWTNLDSAKVFVRDILD